MCDNQCARSDPCIDQACVMCVGNIIACARRDSRHQPGLHSIMNQYKAFIARCYPGMHPASHRPCIVKASPVHHARIISRQSAGMHMIVHTLMSISAVIQAQHQASSKYHARHCPDIISDIIQASCQVSFRHCQVSTMNYYQMAFRHSARCHIGTCI